MSDDKIHVVRVRGKGEPEAFDPWTDIRKIYPAVASITLAYVSDLYPEDSAIRKDFEYLYKCFKVFQIRLAEDKTPLDQQILEYREAMEKVRPGVLNLWNAIQLQLHNVLYSLFVRRDVKVNEQEIRAMFEYAKLTAYRTDLSEETYAKVKTELESKHNLDQDMQSIAASGIGVVVSEDTPRILDNINAVAAQFLGMRHDMSWNELAQACDKIFTERCDTLDPITAACIALAYPTYNNPDLGVCIDETE